MEPQECTPVLDRLCHVLSLWSKYWRLQFLQWIHQQSVLDRLCHVLSLWSKYWRLQF